MLLGVAAPLWEPVALFAGGWLVAQLLGHAGFPLLRLGYAEDGGELGKLGAAAVVAVGVALAGGRRDRVCVRRARRPSPGGGLPTGRS